MHQIHGICKETFDDGGFFIYWRDKGKLLGLNRLYSKDGTILEDDYWYHDKKISDNLSEIAEGEMKELFKK